jgi:hypothetical protein
MKQPAKYPVTLPQPLPGMAPVRMPVAPRPAQPVHRVELVAHPAHHTLVRVVRHTGTGRLVPKR